MKKTNQTKRSLVLSVLSVMLCVAMLIGGTYAWFTDTATTGVNKIQSGNLDIDLVDAEGNSLVGQKLTFKTADGRTENILWEPGCTYELPEVFVKNNGDLAVKYQVVISGITGDAKLNEAIEWTFGGIGDGTLLPKAQSEAITIKGHMKETAGNEYMNLTIDGIAITVNATQATVEKDSYSDQYDKYAIASESVKGNYKVGKVTVLNGANIQATIPATAVLNTEEGAAVVDGETLTLSIANTAVNDNITVFDGEKAETYEISLVDSKGNKVVSSEDIAITLDIGPDRTGSIAVYHNEDRVNGVSYNSTTGIVTFAAKNFSPFTVVEKKVLQGGNGTKTDGGTDDEKDIRATLDLGGVVDFGGAVLKSDSTDGNWGANLREYTFKDGTVVKNLTIIGAASATRWWKAYGNVTFENCTFITNGSYGVHIGEGDGTVTFKNCNINGWNAFGQSLTKLVFENCTFNQKNSGYNCVILRSDADFKGCTFKDNFGIVTDRVGKTFNITIDDCTFDGTAITADNVKTDFPYSSNRGIDSDVWELHNLSVNGVAVAK